MKVGIKDLTGSKYGCLYVVGKSDKSSKRGPLWNCLCDCGSRVIVRKDNLVSGNTKSCGCLKAHILRQRLTTHNQTGGRLGKPSPEYIVWNNMIQRCTNNDYKRWADYGGRGITVCDDWLVFEKFYSDMGNRPGENYEIERVDNSSGYCVSNCIWATRKEQSRNTRRNVNITFNGVTRCLKDWSIHLGINYDTLRKRLSMGWTIERTLSRGATR